MPVTTNISCYRFARLDGLKEMRARLLAFCKARALKGTILLSSEGINLFVAGPRSAVDELVEMVRTIDGLAGLQPKYSESDHQPFTRMLVRIKKEIIAFGVPGIDPATRTSAKISPVTLKRWLDEGRPVTLLDTRNAYEVKLGTFEGAIDLGIDHFRHFPQAAGALPEAMKEAPVVMFCTGGIRCEKAGPFLESVGFKNVLQLDGGILKYFEECGGDHYRGECFVFDQRVGVDPALRETDTSLCHACQSPLRPGDLGDPRYVVGESCPHCFRTSREKMEHSIARREARLAELARPLPGSIPYHNRRPIQVPARHDGDTLVDFLSAVFPQHGCGHWRQICDEGQYLDASGDLLAADHRVCAGDIYFRQYPSTIEPDVDASIRILYEDEALVVVNKPAPLPMHPAGRFHKNTLQYFLCWVYAPQRPSPAHRLDANTSGLVVWTRTRYVARLLQPQFAAGGVEKVYLARVHGHPGQETFESNAAISHGPREAGARCVDSENGLAAHTRFRVLQRREDGTSLLEARPVTGRTNQIRVHLQEAGFPIVGDPVYGPAVLPGAPMTMRLGSPPMGLHAWKLRFLHPLTREPLQFESPVPAWGCGD